MSEQNLEPLLWEKWKASRYSPDTIIGYWAEDGNEYEVTVPAQLRDMLVKLQNDKVDELKAKEPKKEVCKSCTGRGYHYILATNEDGTFSYNDHHCSCKDPKANNNP